MIRNKLGKWMGTCVLVLILCCVGTTSYAATNDFSLKVTKTGYDQDAISKRTIKAGGTSYENRFYVTPTLFSPSGTIQFRSVKLNEKSICSDWIKVSEANKTKNAYYKGTAPGEEYYYLQGAYYSSSDGYSLKVVGRYTP